MFRFANIEVLWLLLTIPAFVAGFILVTRRKHRQLAQFGDPQLLAELAPNVSKSRPIIKFSLLMLALALLIIAAARPQYGQKEKTIKRQGIEVMMALDISNSMLAEDVAPSRLDRAKQMLSRLIDNMVDDKVGLVVFAGEAYTQLPITCDYVSAKMFLNTINPSLIKTQGTALGAAINTSIRSFGAEESEAGRAIILITDGENHEDDAVAAAERAKELGIKILVVGIGKPEGSPIPIPGTNDFKKDRQGNIVVSKLNESMCHEIAETAGGLYVRCDNTNTALKAVMKELETLATADIETTVYADYNEQYQSFALLALLVLLIDFFIFNRKNKSLSKMDIFGENKWLRRTAIVAVLIGITLPTMAQKEAPHVRKGNKEYEKEAYDKAALDYQRGIDKNLKSYEAHYNLGNAYFRQGKYPEAQEAYAEAAKLIPSNDKDLSDKQKQRLAAAYHNLGNASYAQQDFGNAVGAYQEALRLQPKDDETRYNLVKAMQMLQQQQQQQQQQQNQKQDQKQEQKQDQQQQQQQQEQQEEQQQQQAQQDEQQMDKETAEQILQALEQDEQETQEKLQRQQGQKRRVEKDW